MRKIKFRVWLIKENRFLDSYADQGLRFYYNNGGLNPLTDVTWFIECQELENPKRFVVQQFTGIKDVNGVEIYEGDVVEYLGYEVSMGKQIRPKRQIVINPEDYAQKCFYLKNLSEDLNGAVVVVGNIFGARDCRSCKNNDSDVSGDDGACILGHGKCVPLRADCKDFTA
jgi:hypothetical protein